MGTAAAAAGPISARQFTACTPGGDLGGSPRPGIGLTTILHDTQPTGRLLVASGVLAPLPSRAPKPLDTHGSRRPAASCEWLALCRHIDDLLVLVIAGFFSPLQLLPARGLFGEHRWCPPVPVSEESHGGRHEQRPYEGGVDDNGDDHADADELDGADLPGGEPCHYDHEQERGGGDDLAGALQPAGDRGAVVGAGQPFLVDA